MGVSLTDAQVKDMLAGKKILLKGLKSKAGKTYDAYIIPEWNRGIPLHQRRGRKKRGTV